MILAVRGQGKNLIIELNFIVRKRKFEKFDQNCRMFHDRALILGQNQNLVPKNASFKIKLKNKC